MHAPSLCRSGNGGRLTPQAAANDRLCGQHTVQGCAGDKVLPGSCLSAITGLPGSQQRSVGQLRDHGHVRVGRAAVLRLRVCVQPAGEVV